MNDAVLVSMDGDFRSLAPRAGIGRNRFRRLSRIALRCSEPRAAGRVKAAMSLIEHEWKVAQSSLVSVAKGKIVRWNRDF
jgi:hypothetical protein